MRVSQVYVRPNLVTLASRSLSGRAKEGRISSDVAESRHTCGPSLIFKAFHQHTARILYEHIITTDPGLLLYGLNESPAKPFHPGAV